jgi:predicted phosphoribosyltransferase
MIFKDRIHAGKELGEALAGRLDGDLVVLGLPRGGVPVAAEVARILGAPQDVYLVRKLGLPGHEELAMGAIASGGVRVLNEDMVRRMGVSDEAVAAVAAREQQELERREEVYRGDRTPPDVAGRTVVVVDDGLATGSTMRAAVQALRALEPKRIVVAVPVAPPETCSLLEQEADMVVCLSTPDNFRGVGAWYENFSQTSDEEVLQALNRA